jgi:hypothetical protein
VACVGRGDVFVVRGNIEFCRVGMGFVAGESGLGVFVAGPYGIDYGRVVVRIWERAVSAFLFVFMAGGSVVTVGDFDSIIAFVLAWGYGMAWGLLFVTNRVGRKRIGNEQGIYTGFGK